MADDIKKEFLELKKEIAKFKTDLIRAYIIIGIVQGIVIVGFTYFMLH